MSALFKKPTALERRKKQVDRELGLLHDDIRTLKKCVEKPGRLSEVRLKSAERQSGAKERQARSEPVQARISTPVAAEPRAATAPRPESLRRTPATGGDWSRFRSERLTEYLAGSAQTMQPLRHERHIQRNKAILMLVIVAVVLFWVVYRLFIL